MTYVSIAGHSTSIEVTQENNHSLSSTFQRTPLVLSKSTSLQYRKSLLVLASTAILRFYPFRKYDLIYVRYRIVYVFEILVHF